MYTFATGERRTNFSLLEFNRSARAIYARVRNPIKKQTVLPRALAGIYRDCDNIWAERCEIITVENGERLGLRITTEVRSTHGVRRLQIPVSFLNRCHPAAACPSENVQKDVDGELVDRWHTKVSFISFIT